MFKKVFNWLNNNNNNNNQNNNNKLMKFNFGNIYYHLIG